ncbi:hypothetical protein Tco_1533052 [Tanacetum coccineum]
MITQYAVSNKENTTYLCLHFTRNHEDLMTNMPYPEDSIHRIKDRVLEDSGRYQTCEQVGLAGLKAEIDVLAKNIDVMSKRKSEKGLVAESFEWNEELVSSDDEGVTMAYSLYDTTYLAI